VRELLNHLPQTFPAPIVVALHLAPARSHRSQLPALLEGSTGMPVQWAADGLPLKPGHVYVAPADIHTTVAEGHVFAMREAPSRWHPNIALLLCSMAAAAGARAIGVILSGWLDDGAQGARAISEAGGIVLLQDPNSAHRYEMPKAALGAGAKGLVLPPPTLAAALTTLLMAHGAREWFHVRDGSPYHEAAIRGAAASRSRAPGGPAGDEAVRAAWERDMPAERRVDQVEKLTVSLNNSLTRLRRQHARLSALIAEQEARQMDTTVARAVFANVQSSIQTLESCLHHVQHGRQLREASAARRGHATER